MEKLIFVYNADAGYFNMVADIAHKIFSPTTYPCSLCDLTYGIFKIRPEWDDFVQNAPVPFEFLHKDEFLVQYPMLWEIALPVILAQQQGGTQVWIGQEQLDRFATIAELKQAVLDKLRNRIE